MEVADHEVQSPGKRNQPASWFISRRDLIRSAMLASAASTLGPAFAFAQSIESGLTAAARGEDGSKVLTHPNWKPIFLNDEQNETLISLSDVIIPATDTPGAKEALANRFIDLLLSVQSAEVQKQFTDALAFINMESQKQFSKDFQALVLDDQIWLLTPWAYGREPSHWGERHEEPDPGERHFTHLKTMIAAAYYGSEIGQKELGWDGEFTHGPFQGCEHRTETHK